MFGPLAHQIRIWSDVEEVAIARLFNSVASVKNSAEQAFRTMKEAFANMYFKSRPLSIILFYYMHCIFTSSINIFRNSFLHTHMGIFNEFVHDIYTFSMNV